MQLLRPAVSPEMRKTTSEKGEHQGLEVLEVHECPTEI